MITANEVFASGDPQQLQAMIYDNRRIMPAKGIKLDSNSMVSIGRLL